MVLVKKQISPQFGLYKEFFCILIIILSTLFYRINLPKEYYFTLFIFFIISLTSIFVSNIYNPLPIYNYLYEAKITFFYFILILMLFMLTRSNRNTVLALKLFVNVFLFFSIINIFFAYFQRIYFNDIINHFGFNSFDDIRDTFASENDIVIQTQGGVFRAIGTFSTPTVLAEYLLFSGFFFALKFQHICIKLIWFILCAIGVYCTSYKTSLMYLPAVAMLVFLPIAYVKIGTILYSIVLFVFGLISTQTYFIYDIVKDISPLYAEFSIRLRVKFSYDVYSQMKNIWQFLFGVGYGYNGGFLGYFYGSVPLDSIYLWVLSNYGFIGVILALCGLILFYCYRPYKQLKIFDNDYAVLYLLKQYIFLMIIANFFWNNAFINFPSLLFPIVAYFLYHKICAYKSGGI